MCKNHFFPIHKKKELIILYSAIQFLDHVILHNAPAHTSQKTQLEIDLLEFQCLKHPPYSPDLAPMDFAPFLSIKRINIFFSKDFFTFAFFGRGESIFFH
jgi:hypothetical protein